MVCGRCGHVTAPGSTYCRHDRWMLYVDVPEGQRSASTIETIEAPRGMGGLLERRRLEKETHHLERQIALVIDARIERLEKQVEKGENNFEAQRALGTLTLLEGHFERANAHLEHAHKLNPNDYETTVNYAITLAERGQYQPSIDLLQKARTQFPDVPALLLNLALVALQARRASIVLEAVVALEKLWRQNAALAEDFHDEAMTLRGLALLQEGKPNEARVALEAAAKHQIKTTKGATRLDLETGETVEEEESDSLIAAVDIDDEGNIKEVDEEVTQLEGAGASADLLNNLGIAEATAGSFDRAVARLSAAMRLEPGNARVHNNLGILAYSRGQLKMALHHLELAHQIEEFVEKPEPATFNHLGVVLSAMGNNEKSLEMFQRAGGHERAEFEVWYNLGRAFIEHGKPDKGVEYLRRAFQTNPNHPDVHVVLGAAYLLRGQSTLLPEAIKHLKRAIQLNSRHRIAFANLSMALIESDQLGPAYRVVQETLRTHPRSSEGQFLAALLTVRGQGMVAGESAEQVVARAATLFNRAFDGRPDLLVCLYNMALCQYVVGFRDAAAQQLETVVKRDASLAPAYYLIGVGHADAKRYDEALNAWKKAAEYEPGNSDLQANMGYVYYHKQDWENAIRCYIRAHQAAPEEADYVSSLALSYARIGQLPKAVELFRHAMQIRAHDPAIHSNLGLAYYLQKQVPNAVEQWRTVSKLDAGYAERRGEEQERSYDDSAVQIRPFNWRARIVKMAPILPRPHTHLVPGYNARAYRIALSEPELVRVQEMREDLNGKNRFLGWMKQH
ncbi:MAG TPA: tetratricopeptide repeat protein [Abditibacteriaceae bacterium]